MSLGKKAAEHLKALRIYNNLTAEEFASLIGVHRQAVNRWESGRTMLTMKSFDEICKKLGLMPETFICGKPTIKLPSSKS